MPTNDQNEQARGHPELDPENPVSQRNAPGGLADQDAIWRASQEGINPMHADSMPRAEDDALVRATSPEFSDRPRTAAPRRPTPKPRTSSD